jgi:energy-coupling factor transport system ATP-binding protein
VFFIPHVRVGVSVFVAFVVALATLPSLLVSVTSVKKVGRIRGIKSPVALFPPFLEHTLERATGIAFALSLKGFSTERSEIIDEQGRGHLHFDGFSAPGLIARSISWRLPRGAVVVLTGPTGSGKTTLLDSLAGVLDEKRKSASRGLVSTGVSQPELGYVPHQPERLFLASSVEDEIALALCLRGATKEEARARAMRELQEWGLEQLAARHPGLLSSGESVLVAIMSVLVAQPRVLLLDEVLAVLDSSWRHHVIERLSSWSHQQGATVILTDHGHLSESQWSGRWYQLTPNGIHPGRFVAPKPVFPARLPVAKPEPDVVWSCDSVVVRRGDKVLGEDLELSVRRGERLTIIGDNGVGKTTLLETMVELAADSRHLAFVASDPTDLFVASSVEEELRFNDRNLGLSPGFTLQSWASLLVGSCESSAVDELLRCHPRDLSRGQQTTLAISLQMALKPTVLVLDEPTRGLDNAALEALNEVLSCVAETGCAIVTATHDLDRFTLNSDRVLRFEHGRLTPVTEGALHA